MKKKFLILLVMLVTLTVLMGLTGCDNKDSTTEEKTAEPISLMISIEYPNSAKKPDLENFKFKAEEDSTVLEATALYCSSAEIDFLINTTANEAYGINGVNNGETKKDYVWKFQVNEKNTKKNGMEKKLKDGDHITWYYTKK